MKVAIVGYGVEGESAYKYWAQQGTEITIFDQDKNVQLPEGVQAQLGETYLDNLSNYDLIVRTAGLHPNKILANNPALKDKITSVTNEFLRVCPTKNVIGVTGTKGKGTTSTLIAKMLETSGKTVHLGGNIGLAALDMLPAIQDGDWVVLELGAFQTMDLQYSPYIAVCLMVEPEHLDFYATFEEYKEAKMQLFRKQNSDDVAIYSAQNKNSKDIASTSPGKLIPYLASPGAEIIEGTVSISGQAIIRTGEIKLLGRHNWQNICAAVTAVWQITQDTQAMKQVLATFTGLEHRLEFVRELNGVKYYDDSFGTTPETAIVAIEAFEQPKVLILGGSDKGSDYKKLAETVAHSAIRKVLLIGDMAQKIGKELDEAYFKNHESGGTAMTEIVAKAHQFAQPGDIVLLSTACASFGLFKNYKDRGDQFKQAVQALF